MTPPDTLTVAVPYELSTLDPHAKDKLSNASILSNVYEGIVATDAELGIQPCLAVSWDSPSPFTWIFHLRSSVKFHSGRPLRAADVVFSYKRVLHDSDLELGSSYMLDVTDVKVVDPLTVELRTRNPIRILLNKLSHIPIIPEGTAVEEFASGSDGTGPYRVDSWKPGYLLRLKRNEHYWGDEPAIRKVEFVLHCTPEDAMQGFLSGKYHLIKADSKKVAEVVSSRSNRFQLLRHDNLFIKYLGFNLSHQPFADLRVRQAINLAINREKLVGELGNYAEPASQLVPPFVFGFNRRIQSPRQNLDEARLLLKQAEIENDFETTLYTRPIVGEAALLLAEQLRSAGIHLDVKVVPDAEFFALMKSGKARLWLNSAGCASGDASDLFDAVIHSEDRSHGYGMQNFGKFADSALDEAIERSAAIEKLEDRLNALQSIMASAMEKLVLIPIYNDQDVYAVGREITWTPRNDSYVRVADIGFKR